MVLGRLSSVALLLSGVAALVAPERVASALELSPQVAVGATWIGAATARLASLVLDRPRTDTAFWAYLAAEVGFGCLALGTARAQSRRFSAGGRR